MILLPNWLLDILSALNPGSANLHHALLFTGPQGVGKEWLSKSVAAALLCSKRSARGVACGQCDGCRWFGQDSHPDFRWIRPSADEESGESETAPARAAKTSRDIRVEQIRSLAGFVEMASHRGGDKVVLISPAEAMNSAAANALLKTLEEPPPFTRFLLVSSRPDRVPPTVRSRCRVVPVQVPPASEAVEWMASHAGVNRDSAREWLAFCGGAPLRAAELGQGERLDSHRAVTDVFARWAREDPAGAAERIAAAELREWVPVLHAWCIDLARCAAGAGPRYFPGQIRALEPLARVADSTRLLEFESWVAQLGRLVNHPLNARLVAEDALGRYRGVFRPAVRVPGRQSVQTT